MRTRRMQVEAHPFASKRPRPPPPDAGPGGKATIRSRSQHSDGCGCVLSSFHLHDPRQGRAYGAKLFVEDRMPTFIKVLIKGMPKEGERLAAAVARPMIPSVGKGTCFEREEAPWERRIPDRLNAQHDWYRRQTETALFAKLTAGRDLRLLIVFNRAFHELIASKGMPEGQDFQSIVRPPVGDGAGFRDRRHWSSLASTPSTHQSYVCFSRTQSLAREAGSELSAIGPCASRRVDTG